MDDLSRAQYLPSKQSKDGSTVSGGVSAEEDGLMGTDSVAALVAATASDASGGAGMAFVTVGLAVEAAAASERAAGGAGTAASEQVWADNGLMGSVIAVALDAAAAWEVAGFVGIGFGIVRLLIGQQRRRQRRGDGGGG
jgi:hypothetical protein